MSARSTNLLDAAFYVDNPYPTYHWMFFEELVRRVGAMRLVEGSVVEMPNAFVYGLKSARVVFEPASAPTRHASA
jgi:hypothetical protein